MATDPYLMERILNVLQEKKVQFVNKRMFGGNCIMVEDKMCFGTYRNGLMVRIGEESVAELITRDGAEQMMQNQDRPMRGYLFIQPEGYDLEEDLDFWIQKCLDYNPLAKSGKKKSK